MREKTLAIMGNPNSGKTTLFNRLTGANQHVGNWPGVTVEQKTGMVEEGDTLIRLTDLPGVYSLSPYTQEELIARAYVLSDKPEGIVNIVDAGNLERSLYLTLQLIALGLPMLVVLGFMDDVRRQGTEIDCEALSRALGVPVVGVSAKTGENLDRLRRMLAAPLSPPVRQPAYRKGVHAAIRRAAAVLEDSPVHPASRYFYAHKLLEGDEAIEAQLGLSPAAMRQIAEAGEALVGASRGADREMVLADAMYAFIEDAVRQSVWGTAHTKRTATERIDRVVLHRLLALPIFGLVMLLVFTITFGPPGAFLRDGLEGWIAGALIPAARLALNRMGAAPWLGALVCEGVLPGVGSVISFLPQIVLLFFCLSILEDTGYLARIAFVMDTLLRRIGLSGKSCVPLLMGFGCTTSAVMAARTMEHEKDRKMTVLLTPFMSCGAKLPVYAVVAGALFGKRAGLVVFSLYMLGIAMAAFSGFVLGRTLFRGVSAGFVLELPAYRMPTVKGTLLTLWHRARDFMAKAGTVIFLMSLVIWTLQSVTPGLQPAQSAQESILGLVGQGLAPLFAPLGFGQWEAAVALLAGLVAKEGVVSTMSVLYGAGGDTALLAGALSAAFTPLAGYSFLVFVLLYMPCMSAFATMRRELGGTLPALGAAAVQTAIAYAAAVLVYQIGSLIG